MNNEMLGNGEQNEDIPKDKHENVPEVADEGRNLEVISDLKKIDSKIPHITERVNPNKEVIENEEKELKKNENNVDVWIKDFYNNRKEYYNGQLPWDTVENKVNYLITQAEELYSTSGLLSQKVQLEEYIKNMKEFLKTNKEKEIGKALDGLIKDFSSICEGSNNGESPWDTVKESIENLIVKAKELLGKSGLSPRKKEIEDHIKKMQEFLNYNQPK